MNEVERKFLTLIKELFDLYKDIKSTIILAENFDNNDEIYLTLINEVRMGFDHVMRGAHYLYEGGDKEKIISCFEKELIDARDHLLRAGYDSCEIISMNVSKTIIEDLKGFDKDIISTIYPDYYTNIQPQLMQLKVELGEIRANRENPKNSIKVETFKMTQKRAIELIEFSKKIKGLIPELVEFQKQRKKRFWKSIWFQLLIGVILIILGIVIGLFIN